MLQLKVHIVIVREICLRIESSWRWRCIESIVESDWRSIVSTCDKLLNLFRAKCELTSLTTQAPKSYLECELMYGSNGFGWRQPRWALRCIGVWGLINLYGSNGLGGLYHVSMHVVSPFSEKYGVVIRCTIHSIMWSTGLHFFPMSWSIHVAEMPCS